MHHLTAEQELNLTMFTDQLSVVIGPDDMFPPETGGVREPIPEPLPFYPTSEALCLASIHHMAEHVQRKALLAHAGRLATEIDALLGAD
jgi:hypothetical protein